MSNHFAGRGNLGADPDLKHVEIDGEPRAVAALRIYFDRPVPDGDGGFTDKGGFWLPVNLWGPKAETIAKLLRKGRTGARRGDARAGHVGRQGDRRAGEPHRGAGRQHRPRSRSGRSDHLPRERRWRTHGPPPGSCAPPRTRAERRSLTQGRSPDS